MYLTGTPSKKSWRSSLKEKLFTFLFQTGMVRAGRGLWSNTLTVLNYHRIEDTARAGFDTFKPNVSARPEEFALQLDYLTRWFRVVSLREVVAWLDGEKTLPPHAALITFDDGYLDNYTQAYPILRERDLPATIFLTTGHIQQDDPFYWDMIAYCFHHTRRDTVAFPDGRQGHWKNETELGRVSNELIESLKLLAETEKQAWVARLPEMLDVSIPAGHFKNLMMSWNQIREMRRGGIEFGGHTMHHPILTRIALEQANEEIAGSKARIEQELGETVHGFAYPNGGKKDFNRAIEQMTAAAGYRVAFTLLNGPAGHREVKRDPFAIRRIFVSHKHTLPQFAALVSGFNRFRSP